MIYVSSAEAKTIVWALFDSENSCYKKAIEKHFPNARVYSVGLSSSSQAPDENAPYMRLDLANFNHAMPFKGGGLKQDIFSWLKDRLPHPDIILVSPPCESWSQLTSLSQGNIGWKKLETFCDTTKKTKATYAVRDRESFDKGVSRAGFIMANCDFMTSFYKRINGELCIANTIEIIKKFKPKMWAIENPAGSKIWDYISFVLGFNTYEGKGLYKNYARYNNYDQNFSEKPTCFLSNKNFELKNKVKRTRFGVTQRKNKAREDVLGVQKDAASRSDIPESLIIELFDGLMAKEEQLEFEFMIERSGA